LLVQVARGKLDLPFLAPPCLLGPELLAQREAHSRPEVASAP